MTEHNLPEPDDAPWLNLTQEEVEELRNKKHELTEYGKEQLRKLIYEQDMKKMKDAIDQKVLELMDKDLIFYTKGKETSRIPSPTLEDLTLGTKAPEFKLKVEKTMEDRFYPDEMFEEAERREKLNAGFKQDENGNWYRPTLQELTRNERIELAEKEIAYMVMGGQDGREYANSIAFLLQVLDSLKDKESDFEDSANGVA
jgi:hypothetical protein